MIQLRIIKPIAITITFLFINSSAMPQQFPQAEAVMEKYNIESGTFLLHDLTKDITKIHNPGLADTRVCPASTFKILNSLIALEMNIIEGPEHILKWDGVKRQQYNGNHDHTLASAFSNSIVWYYQKIAQQVGLEGYKAYFQKLQLGNQETGSAPEMLWLDNTFRISPVEQLQFLKQLCTSSLDFSQKSMDQVKDLMIWWQNDSITIRGKTGMTGVIDGYRNGWFIGWVEKNDERYLFVTLIKEKDPDDHSFAHKRTDITLDILTHIGIIPPLPPVRQIGVPLATIDEMIGQMIMVGMEGTSTTENAALLQALQQGKAGGVILFEKNIANNNSAEQIHRVITEFQAATEIPLFIAIDQEGGVVNRLKTKYGFPPSKTATWLGKTDNIDTTFRYAMLTASTLKKLGINLNFAPVVDLCSNVDNPIIAGYGRCFSDDPYVVAKHAGWVIQAHHRHGVVTTLKHFPGHGSSQGDTHKDMTDVTGLWTTNELIPYRELVNMHLVDAIMTAHIVNCDLDPDCNPATLSKTIVTDILRDNLNFNGVVFSDDMKMKAISTYYGLEKSVKMAILAGVDVILYCHKIKGENELPVLVIHRTIKKLVEEGEIPRERIYESYERIIELKRAVFPFEKFPEYQPFIKRK